MGWLSKELGDRRASRPLLRQARGDVGPLVRDRRDRVTTVVSLLGEPLVPPASINLYAILADGQGR